MCAIISLQMSCAGVKSQAICIQSLVLTVEKSLDQICHTHCCATDGGTTDSAIQAALMGRSQTAICCDPDHLLQSLPPTISELE